MRNRGYVVLSSLLVLALMVTARGVQAQGYNSVVAYGDSLSDNGNLYAVSGVPQSPPYYNGQFSNGPNAIVQLSNLLGVPLNDHAWGGATTGIGNIGDGGTQTSFGTFHLPGMLTQLFFAPPTPSQAANSLFVVWGGADDFESGGSPTTAVGNIDAIVAALEGAGATHILVPGLPNLADTPEFAGNAGAAAYSLAFNTGLEATLPAGATYFDVNSLLSEILANPGAFGFTNTTTPCLVGTTICSDPNQYLFWDDIHPTTAADAILAENFLEAVRPAATPEPSSLVLLGSGLMGLAAMARRRRV